MIVSQLARNALEIAAGGDHALLALDEGEKLFGGEFGIRDHQAIPGETSEVLVKPSQENLQAVVQHGMPDRREVRALVHNQAKYRQKSRPLKTPPIKITGTAKAMSPTAAIGHSARTPSP